MPLSYLAISSSITTAAQLGSRQLEQRESPEWVGIRDGGDDTMEEDEWEWL